jgi:hypothetical protein
MTLASAPFIRRPSPRLLDARRTADSHSGAFEFARAAIIFVDVPSLVLSLTCARRRHSPDLWFLFEIWPPATSTTSAREDQIAASAHSGCLGVTPSVALIVSNVPSTRLERINRVWRRRQQPRESPTRRQRRQQRLTLGRIHRALLAIHCVGFLGAESLHFSVWSITVFTLIFQVPQAKQALSCAPQTAHSRHDGDRRLRVRAERGAVWIARAHHERVEGADACWKVSLNRT